jgi:hypothetical protein
MLSARYNDWHPAFHTFTKWLITRLWLSPASVALAQIIALSALAGLGLVLLGRLHVPSAIVWGTCLIFALSPANISMVNTLWKDTAYGIAVLALTLLVLQVVMTRGVRLGERWFCLLFGGVAALVALYRHNGPPAAFGTLVAVAVAYPFQRTRALAALLTALGLWMSVRVPLYDVVGVARSQWVGLQPLVHQVAAQIDAGTKVSEAEAGYLDSIRPIADHWRYSCYTINPTLFDGRFSAAPIEADPWRFVRLWASLTWRNPGVTLRHLICSSALVWRITEPADNLLEGPAVWVSDDDTVIVTFGYPIAGFEPASLLPSYRLPLAKWIMRTVHDPSLSWLFWRPALYLYLSFAGFAVASLTRGDRRFLLCVVPVAVHSLTLAPIVLVEHFRFQYPVFLVGALLGAPLLAAALCRRTNRCDA